jgi:hypothetical protein
LPCKHAPQARSNFITRATERGIVGKKLATIFKLPNVTVGLGLAPSAKGIKADVEQIGFSTMRKAEPCHGLTRRQRQGEFFQDTVKNVALGNTAGVAFIDGCPQRGKRSLVSLFLTLQRPQRRANNFTGVLVAPTLNLLQHDGVALTYQWSLVSAPSGSTATILNPTAQIASFVPDLPGTFVVQLIVNDGYLNSLPATAQIAVVSQQPSLIQQIQERQGVIRTLPNDGFKGAWARELISIELNDVLLSLEHKRYSLALLVIKIILAQTDGCATTGAPDRTDLITNCSVQSEFYPALLNIEAEVEALVQPPVPTP